MPPKIVSITADDPNASPRNHTTGGGGSVRRRQSLTAQLVAAAAADAKVAAKIAGTNGTSSSRRPSSAARRKSTASSSTAATEDGLSSRKDSKAKLGGEGGCGGSRSAVVAVSDLRTTGLLGGGDSDSSSHSPIRTNFGGDGGHSPFAYGGGGSSRGKTTNTTSPMRGARNTTTNTANGITIFNNRNRTPSPMAARPQSPDSKSMRPSTAIGGGLGGVGGGGGIVGGSHIMNTTSLPPMDLNAFTAFSHRKLEQTAGQRMARLRRQYSVPIASIVGACRLGVATHYEAVESGGSAIERWASLLGRFAVNLELPVDALLPYVADPPPNGNNGVGGSSINMPGGAGGLSASLRSSNKSFAAAGGATNAATLPAFDTNNGAAAAAGGLSGSMALSMAAASSFALHSGAGGTTTTTTTVVGACGARLKQMRLDKGVAPEMVYARTGLTQAEYRQIESGESTSGYEKWVWVLARYCKHLNVNPFLVVGGLPVDQPSDSDDDDDDDLFGSQLEGSGMLMSF